MESRAASAGVERPLAREIPGARGDDDEQSGDSGGERGQRRTPFRCGRPGGHCGLCLRGNADPKRIDPDRLGDVLELGLAEIADREIEPAFDLAIGVLGKADRARLGDALDPRGDVDAVAHQVAVALLDDIAEMNADAKLDALVERDAGVALDHGVLHFEGAAHRVDDAAELDDAAVAGALDDAAMMHGDCRIDQIAAQRAQPRQRSIFVRAGEPAIADHIRD